MPPRVRKLALTVHVALSVGWIGAVAAYLALDVAAVASQDPDTVRAAYLGMHLIAVRVIVPLAVAALVSGILMAIGTPWGLFRHYWVLVSLRLTTLAAGVLLVETSTVRHLAAVAADPATSPAQLQGPAANPQLRPPDRRPTVPCHDRGRQVARHLHRSGCRQGHVADVRGGMA